MSAKKPASDENRVAELEARVAELERALGLNRKG